VHIPFCERKCLYCDFYSVAGTEQVEAFLVALDREIMLRAQHQDPATYETLFFGGGTPSVLTPRQLETILKRLRASFCIASDAEITLEANPGTVTEESLQAYRALGVNRLSLGIQSFQDHELDLLGRIHDRTEALRCVGWSRKAGFENVNLDLIYAIPGQIQTQWEDNLRIAVDLAPQHIAAYCLSVEERTPFARMVQAGVIPAHPTELEACLYQRTMELLPLYGYQQYEVSNYARPGFCCRHNRAYWSHEDYLGFGPSAHSFWKQRDRLAGQRWWNVSDLSAYINHLTRGSVPVAAAEDVGARELAHERILLGLRGDGLDLECVSPASGCGPSVWQTDLIRALFEEGLAVREGKLLRLTRKGYVLCDEICARFSRDAGALRAASTPASSPSG